MNCQDYQDVHDHLSDAVFALSNCVEAAEDHDTLCGIARLLTEAQFQLLSLRPGSHAKEDHILAAPDSERNQR